MTIEGFRKVNGQSSNVNGLQTYQMFFDADVSLPKGFHPECAGGGNQFRGFDCWFVSVDGVQPQPLGAVLHYAGTITFESSEKGWLPANVSTHRASAESTGQAEPVASVGGADSNTDRALANGWHVTFSASSDSVGGGDNLELRTRQATDDIERIGRENGYTILGVSRPSSNLIRVDLGEDTDPSAKYVLAAALGTDFSVTEMMTNNPK